MSLLGRLGRSSAEEALAFERELDVFVREHYGRLIRLAGLVCRDAGHAEDAVQAALEQAWRRRATLRDRASLKPWLDRIVVREAIRLGRRERSILARLFPQPREIPVEPAGPFDPTASSAATRIAFRAALDALPPAQRAVVALHLYAGYSIAETAEIVGVPVETARSRLRLARDRLRDTVAEASR